MVFVSKHHQIKIGKVDLKVGDITISSVEHVRNLGAYFDSGMTMVRHVSQKCSSAYFALKQIGKLRPYLSQKACNSAVQSLVMSRMDYTSALLGGLPQIQLYRMQKLQNSAARLITKTKIRDHITPVMRKLHWLPVRSRIKYRLCSYMYKITKKLAPLYMRNDVQPYIPSRSLRSGKDKTKLQRVYGKTKFADFDYAVTGPKHWETLPADIRDSDTFSSFRRRLKTFLFNEHYL